MALSTANIVQQNSGSRSTTTTSHAITLPGGTTAGNTVLVFATSADLSNDIIAPAGGGWVLDLDHATGLQAYRLTNVGAGVTSWTFTTSVATVDAWYVAEVSGLETTDPVDAFVNNVGGTTTSGSTQTYTTPVTAGVSTIAFMVRTGRDAGNAGTTYSWSADTNGFVERVDVGGPSPTPNIAVAVNTATVSQAWSSTTTFTTSNAAGATAIGFLISYREANTAIVAPLSLMLGFEWGTHGGAALLNAAGLWGSSTNPVGTWGTSYLIQAASARASGYGLRIVASATTVNITAGSQTGFMQVGGMNVRVVSGSGVVIVAEMLGVGNVLAGQLVYDVTNTKFGMRSLATGTISYQSGTTALNTWVWIDWRVNTSATTFTADWRIETGTDTYTAQTSAASAAGQTSVSMLTFRFGSGTSQTMTADYDDYVTTRLGGLYPLGPHQIRVLRVDPAGTATVTSPSTDWNTYSANGTLAAWDAAAARDAVDELPPTVSAAADGIVQVAVNANAYVELPMETYTLGPKEVIAGVRAYAALWASVAGGVVTVGLRGWDGTVESLIVAVGTTFSPGQPTAYASGAPVWRCGMWPKVNGWKQAELNAAAVRFGFSTNDAPGLQAAYLEVAVARTRARTLFGTLASVEGDPFRYGVVSTSTTSPVMGDTTFYYEQSSSPTTVVVPAGTTDVEQPNGAFDADVNYIAAYPPPEPDPSA